MTDILQIINDLTANLWARYGNPLASYKKNQNDIHMTYYVGRLMEEQGHKYVMQWSELGEHAGGVYYSEKALHDAFLAGQLLAKADNDKMRAAIISEIREELHAAVDNMEL